MSKNQNGELDKENSPDHSLFNLLKRVAEGDSLAENMMFAAYAEKLGALASRNIQQGLRKRFDHDDVVQSVFRTFFRRNENGEFQINNSRQLWSLLAQITVRKSRSYARNQLADKRNPKHEKADEAVELQSADHPDAEALAIVQEEINSALTGLPDKAGEILALRLSGHSKTEIAELTNRSRQTVHSTLKFIYDRLQQSFDQSDEA